MTRAAPGVRGVFVDRDGTLIRDVGYLVRPQELEILPRVPEAIRVLREHGLKVVLVTNQSAIARGFLREDELREIHRELKRQLAASDALLDGIYYCPHHPTEGSAPYRVACECRKPGPALAERAARELGLDTTRSYVVGDQMGDMGLASRIGAKGILIQKNKAGNGEQKAEADFPVAGDLWEAAQWIVRHLRDTLPGGRQVK